MTARLIVKRTFQDVEGCTILEAPDGAVALSVLESQHPVDVVVLDWNMPVMDGFECLQNIRKNPAYSDVKILMCTTEAEKSSVVKAIKAGANGYILKPVDGESLKAQVVKMCGASSKV